MKHLFNLFILLFLFSNTNGQCPTITCPANITVNNSPGNCSAIVNYTAPVGTDPCSSGGSSTFNFTGSVQTFTVPDGVTFLGGVNDMPSGSIGYFYADIKPGKYALISEVPHAKSKGMLKVFEVNH